MNECYECYEPQGSQKKTEPVEVYRFSRDVSNMSLEALKELNTTYIENQRNRRVDSQK